MKDLFSLSNQFLHKPLALEILSRFARFELEAKCEAINNSTDGLKEPFINALFAEAILRHLEAGNIQSLDEKLVNNETLPLGSLIWFENSFYFKGAVKASTAFKNGTDPAYAEFNMTLNRYEGLKVSGRINAKHFTSSSSTGILTGRTTKFIIAYIQQITGEVITLRSLLIGDRIINNGFSHLHHINPLEVKPEQIDEFKNITSIKKYPDVNEAKDISEEQIKNWFAEIIGESNVPKDWGGENSDLFSPRLHINNERHSVAFLFKGPSKFHQMQVKDLGKNGNQIGRLYEEQADIFILQHCHYITSDVRKLMYAFATMPNKVRKYCIIDGVDTLRILKAYKKI